MRLFLFLLVLATCSNAYAARVLLDKSTGKLLEYQSDASPGTLTKNYLDNPQYGYTENQIDEKEVTKSEWLVLKEKWVDSPNKKIHDDKVAARKSKDDAIKQKLNLTDQDFKDLKEALSD